MPDASSPIGIFDSGSGGLAILAELHALLPSEDLIYFADTAFFPYGPRPASEIRDRADAVTRELLDRGAKLIVVACNTATSAAIAHLRQTFDVPFVGVEPPLKPAAERTISDRVALLVTPGTARGQKLAALIDRYGAEVTVDTIEAPGLAERVEAGDLDGEETRALLHAYLARVARSGADVLALGCTHYAFLRPAIERELGEGVVVIDPAPAVARQVQRLLGESALLTNRTGPASVVYLTSGDERLCAETRQRLRDAGAAIPEGAPVLGR